jgi:hypothetical protein
MKGGGGGSEEWLLSAQVTCRSVCVPTRWAARVRGNRDEWHGVSK